MDVGLRTGLALFGPDGRLRWYRSRNLGNMARLRRRVRSLLDELPEVASLVLEGGGRQAEVWVREAERRGLPATVVFAEEWRERLLRPRDRRDGATAKRAAEGLALRVAEWSGAPRRVPPTTDAAEAILVGLWACLGEGRLDELPPGVPGR